MAYLAIKRLFVWLVWPIDRDVLYRAIHVRVRVSACFLFFYCFFDSAFMFHIVLVSPEIPPNTGNVIRLAANSGATLHLVRPLGFNLEDKKLKRAGLDYHEWARMLVHDSLEQALQHTGAAPERCFALTTHASRLLGELQFQPGDVFVFGSETAGLSADHLALFAPAQRVRLPMMPGQRSLNLSNAVAVTVFEAWRQCNWEGGV